MQSSDSYSQDLMMGLSSVIQTEPPISLLSDHFTNHITINHWNFINNEALYEKKYKAEDSQADSNEYSFFQ